MGWNFLFILGVQFKEPIKKINNKSLLKKIGEYLNYDSYMYTSLVAPQSISPPPAGTFPFSVLFIIII